jgi:hypothetical protein
LSTEHNVVSITLNLGNSDFIMPMMRPEIARLTTFTASKTKSQNFFRASCN